jgi:thymidine kinase
MKASAEIRKAKKNTRIQYEALLEALISAVKDDAPIVSAVIGTMWSKKTHTVSRLTRDLTALGIDVVIVSPHTDTRESGYVERYLRSANWPYSNRFHYVDSRPQTDSNGKIWSWYSVFTQPEVRSGWMLNDRFLPEEKRRVWTHAIVPKAKKGFVEPSHEKVCVSLSCETIDAKLSDQLFGENEEGENVMLLTPRNDVMLLIPDELGGNVFLAEEHVKYRPKVCILDEAQFVSDTELLDFVRRTFDHEVSVVCVGLVSTGTQDNFGGIGRILCLCTHTVHLTGQCDVCEERPSLHNMVKSEDLFSDGSAIHVGGSDLYYTCCNVCFWKSKRENRKRKEMSKLSTVNHEIPSKEGILETFDPISSLKELDSKS